MLDPLFKCFQCNINACLFRVNQRYPRHRCAIFIQSRYLDFTPKKPMMAGRTIRSKNNANKITIPDKSPKLIRGLKHARTSVRKPRLRTMLVKMIGLPTLFIAMARATLVSSACLRSIFSRDKNESYHQPPAPTRSLQSLWFRHRERFPARALKPW